MRRIQAGTGSGVTSGRGCTSQVGINAITENSDEQAINSPNNEDGGYDSDNETHHVKTSQKTFKRRPFGKQQIKSYREQHH